MPNLGKVTTKQVLAIRKKDLIKKEIKSHGHGWCDPWCHTFDPAEYRKKRLAGYSAKELQSHPELCHERD